MGTLGQAGKTVATLDAGKVTLDGLRLNAAGSTVRVSGAAGLDGRADLDLTADGMLSGVLKAKYRARSLSLAGQLEGPQNLAAAVDLRADPFTGWHGDVRVSGGPSLGGSGDVLTAPAVLSVSGPLAHPLAQGTAGLLGAGRASWPRRPACRCGWWTVPAPAQTARWACGPARTASGVGTARSA